MTREEFQEMLGEAGDKLVLVFFFATWCNPCRRIAPEFETMAGEEKFANVAFFSVDTNENVMTAEYYSVNALPTFILYRNGLKVERFSGADRQKLRDFLQRHVPS